MSANCLPRESETKLLDSPPILWKESKTDPLEVSPSNYKKRYTKNILKEFLILFNRNKRNINIFKKPCFSVRPGFFFNKRWGENINIYKKTKFVHYFRKIICFHFDIVKSLMLSRKEKEEWTIFLINLESIWKMLPLTLIPKKCSSKFN